MTWRTCRRALLWGLAVAIVLNGVLCMFGVGP